MSTYDETSAGQKSPGLAKATRFRKGQSGNPKGRPKGVHREAPYEAVLGQLVTIRDGGMERQVTACEAFLLHLTKQGLEGNGFATSVMSDLLELARSRALADRNSGHLVIIHQIVSPGSVIPALEILRMTKMLDEYRESARVVLQPWIVQAALDRLGDKRLAHHDQAIIVRATRQPQKVRWPHWWEVH